MKLFNHGGNCQLHECEFALYFAMEQTNLGDLILLMVILFNHGGNCQLHECEFALYVAMERTNLGDLCLRPKQTEILLNVWLEIGSHSGSYFNKVKDKRAGQELEIQQHP